MRPCRLLWKVSQGIDILNHRQKLKRLADSSDAGWRVVMEYEAHPLAENEDDEKKIYRSQRDAERKLRQERKARNTRYSPFSRYGRYFQGQTLTPENKDIAGSSTTWNQTNVSAGRKPGTCFRCGRPGHWRNDCRAGLQNDGGFMNKDVQSNSKISCSLLYLSTQNAECENSSKISTPVGKLKSCINH